MSFASIASRAKFNDGGMMRSRIAGLVLAGGRATRLGGGDKPLRMLADTPMMSHVIRRLAPQVDEMAISANGDPIRFSAYGLPVLADSGPAGQAGPLSGVLSGLEWLRRETSCYRLLTVAGDTPFFPADLAHRLSAAAEGYPERVAVSSSGERRHPVFALWPVSLADELALFLVEGKTFKVNAFLESVDVATVEFPLMPIADSKIDPFFNVNTPEDLAEAEEILQRMTS
jgi:molybdopterin-guanine dinucleotide biosynthesis protein A